MKILIMNFARMGDLIQSFPLVCALKHKYPNSQIDYLSFQAMLGTLKLCPQIDQTLSFDQNETQIILNTQRANMPHVLELLQKRQDLHGPYDLLINLDAGLSAATLSAVIPAAEKRGRIGAKVGQLNLTGAWSKYLFAMQEEPALNLFNMADIYLGIGQAHGNKTQTSQAAPKPASLALPKIAVHMGASTKERRWSVHNFAQVINALPAQWVLVGGKEQQPLAEELLKHCQRDIKNTIGRTDLRQLSSIFENCDLLLSTDSGPAHLAGYLGLNTLVLSFASAYMGESAPYGAGHFVLQSHEPCAPCRKPEQCTENLRCQTSLQADMVLDVLQHILGHKPLDTWTHNPVGLYQSAFVNNGSLLYVPFAGKVELNYQKAWLRRIFWQNIFGLSSQGEIENRLFKRLSDQQEFIELQAQEQEHWHTVHNHYNAALDAVKGMQSHQPTTTATNTLENLEEQFPQIATPSFARFHQYELMDQPQGAPENFVQFLTEKYNKLLNYCQS